MGSALSVTLIALFAAAASGLGVRPDAGPSDDIRLACRRAQRLQDDARMLRNGARSGAPIAELALLQARLRDNLNALVLMHDRWGSALEPAQRRRVAAHLATVVAGCERIRAHLDGLAGALADRELERRRIQALGQAIGRQSGICERALRAAERERRARPT
jgi:hypothetical protein